MFQTLPEEIFGLMFIVILVMSVTTMPFNPSVISD